MMVLAWKDHPPMSSSKAVKRTVEILLPLPFDHGFDYTIPDDGTLDVGHFVTVNFRNRLVHGVVWHLDPPPATYRVKEIIRPLDQPPLPPALVTFIRWVAGYTLSPVGSVLKMVMSNPQFLDHAPRVKKYHLAPQMPDFAKTPQRERVMAILNEAGPLPLQDLTEIAAVTPAVVKKMLDLGALTVSEEKCLFRTTFPEQIPQGPLLEPFQKRALETLLKSFNPPDFRPFLLDGVTGSGKTEVYFEALAHTLSQGRQTLVLLPEIALSSQWSQRFESRFGFKPDQWHSAMTPAQRRDTWQRVARGLSPVVVGARSALLLPYPNLGFIVVDEEHDQSYKQEEGIFYNARDMAVVRASLEKIPIVLASATPSVETITNAHAGKYGHLHMPMRYGCAVMPQIHLVNMRQEKTDAQHFLSHTLIKALKDALETQSQAMLFLNRRGYAPLTLCRGCGHREMCASCSAWLVEHRGHHQLRCHHCGFTKPFPKICPECQAPDSFVPCGPGVERICDEVKTLFPQARVRVVTSDTLSGPREMHDLITAIDAQEVDILIGTQMMAKGYHFPNLTVVGVVDADLGLSGGDLRAGERTYQLLHQVSGRAGRAEKPGHVFLQTFMPEHPIMVALQTGSREDFLEQEIYGREMTHMPPFGKLAGIIISGPQGEQVENTARLLARHFPPNTGADILGPTPAPLALLRNRHRWRLLVRAPQECRLQKVIHAWLSTLSIPNQVHVQVDMDPYSFY